MVVNLKNKCYNIALYAVFFFAYVVYTPIVMK